MKTIKYLIIGLGIGFICTTFFMLLFMGFNIVTTQIFAWFIASGIYGVSAMIFENQKLSILFKCIIHYFIALSVTSVITLMFYKPYAISVAISFTIAYSVIFFIMWQVEKYNIKKMNEKLKER